MNIKDYTEEIVDMIMKVAHIEPIQKHKILRKVQTLKSYKEFRYKTLETKKQAKPRKPTSPIPFSKLTTKNQKLIIAACEKFDMSVNDFCTNYKTNEIVEVQRVVIYFMHVILGFSSKKVGLIFMKDHSTILNACQVHRDKMEVDRMYSQLYYAFKKEAEKIIFESLPPPKP
jgi:chromosomal replication initiation ATPase DnaA